MALGCSSAGMPKRTLSVVVNASTGERQPLRREVRIQPSLWDNC